MNLIEWDFTSPERAKSEADETVASVHVRSMLNNLEYKVASNCGFVENYNNVIRKWYHVMCNHKMIFNRGVWAAVVNPLTSCH